VFGRSKQPVRIVVGLGNIGSQYERTRHNMGFMAMDRLSRALDIPLTKKGFHATYGVGKVGTTRVVLVKPTTYMNESGISVGEVLRYYNADLTDLLVIYDDIDLPCGKLRMRLSGSAGTHNGMRSILQHVDGQNFPRLRVGVGRPLPGQELVNFVLGIPSPEQQQQIGPALDLAAEAAEVWIRQTADAAMQLANRKEA